MAATLEIGCALVRRPTDRSVLLAFWDCEEPPAFLTDQMGSEYFAANPPLPLSSIEVAVIMDLLGASMWPQFEGLFVLGTETSPVVNATVGALPVPEGLSAYIGGLHLAEEQPTRRQAWSDYDGFRNRGVPVAFVTAAQNKTYHTALDDFAHIDLARFAREMDYMHGMVRALADQAAEMVWQPVPHLGISELHMLVRLLERALGEGGLVDTIGLTERSRELIQGDLERLTDVQFRKVARLDLSDEDVANLRRATQHMMCLAGSSYPEATCGLF